MTGSCQFPLGSLSAILSALATHDYDLRTLPDGGGSPGEPLPGAAEEIPVPGAGKESANRGRPHMLLTRARVEQYLRWIRRGGSPSVALGSNGLAVLVGALARVAPEARGGRPVLAGMEGVTVRGVPLAELIARAVAAEGRHQFLPESAVHVLWAAAKLGARHEKQLLQW